MFKQNISYVDFNGIQRNEDFYFHLSLPEVTRLEAEIGRPMDEHVKDIVANQDLKTLIDFLENMILNSYGRKTSDGKSFHKTKEMRLEFEHSQAYAELFEMLLTNPELAKKFGAGVADNGKMKNVSAAQQSKTSE
jgi:hypothetical protein